MSYTTELCERIAVCCGFSNQPPLLARIYAVLGEPIDDPKPTPVLASEPKTPNPITPAPPFGIPRKRLPLRIATVRAFNSFADRIRAVQGIRKAAEAYQAEAYQKDSVIPKLALKMADDIEADKRMPVYQDGEDNAERLAGYVLSRVLIRHVKALSETLFKLSGTDRAPMLAGLTQALHNYLSKLGVYTVIARPGMKYDDVMEFYEVIVPGPAEDIIEEVISPAYVLEYVDEDNEKQKVVLQGKCTLRRKVNGIR